MARGRMINEVIILSRKLNSISEGAENLYYRIYVKSDDYGRFHADSVIVKGQVYTLRNISCGIVGKRILELAQIGLIKRYEVNGEMYLEIVKFEEHQSFRSDIKRKALYPKPVTYLNEDVTERNEKIKPETSKKTSKSLTSKSKGNNKSKSKDINAIDIRLTQLLIDLMQENDPKSYIVKSLTEKRQEEWINQCRLLREKDERSEQEIETIIRWSQKNEFWKGNILSMATLRKQFSQLWLKAKKEKFAGIKEWLNES